MINRDMFKQFKFVRDIKVEQVQDITVLIGDTTEAERFDLYDVLYDILNRVDPDLVQFHIRQVNEVENGKS